MGIIGLLFALALVGALAFSHVATAEEGEDFGDAPEPTYPTTRAFNGANHVVVQGFSLGPNIDSEPDGQPSLLADGDDIGAVDDEDGITFQSALIPGLEACIDANLTNTVQMANPMLDGWIDFDANGMWDPPEHLWGGASQPLSPGSNILCFTVPPFASRGPTYARFRLSDGGGMLPDGPSTTPGEVEDYKVYIEFTKWDQPPTKKNEEDACYWGWDDVSIYGDAGEPGFPIVADDWECRDGRPVTDIHWWGSYEGWYDDDPPFDPPPPQYQPSQFHIGVWTDVPATGSEFSHPGILLQEWIVNLSDLNEQYAGCDFYEGTMQNPDTCFYYDFEIPEGEWFFQDPDVDHVYWLSISAIYPNNELPSEYLWGWKTRKPEWNDDAVRIFAPDAPKVSDPYLDGEPIETAEEGSWDTSFVLTSLPTEPQAPVLDITIDTTPTDASLSWPHVTTDIGGNAITVNRYYIYRDTTPYKAPSATQYSIIDGPFVPGDVTFFDPGVIGSASQNYYYYVRAAVTDRYGNDVLSAYSNHVGEFDFTLVPGS
jgi:hypothetical protein